MIKEILLGIVLGALLLGLYYLYLKWSATWADKYVKYQINPNFVVKSDATYLGSYGWLLPPMQISDGFKVVNFWIDYYFISNTVNL